jgi:hypothetical protein
MNEHTKLLIMKAGGIICSTVATGHIDKIDYLHFDAEKFAELIVKECEVALKPPVQVRDVISRGQAYDLIKKHFGVEERKGWVCPKCGVDRTREACPRGHTVAITGDCPMTATAQSGVEV